MGSKQLALIGYFHEIYELANKAGFNVTAIVDPLYDEVKNNSISSYATDEIFLSKNTPIKVFLTPDSPAVRKSLFNLYNKSIHKFVTLICPTAVISKTAVVGEANCIQSGVNISSHVILGTGVRVNSNANVMHDCDIGDFCTVAPNAVLLGGVKVGHSSYIGANATILPNILIGNEVIVGAGSVVTKNVPNGTVVCGNPARKLR